jgi:hypothetical protein
MYCRMVIGECLSADQIKEFSRLFEEEKSIIKDEPGAFSPPEYLIEEGGRMVIVLRFWENPRGLPSLPLVPFLPAICRQNEPPARRRLCGRSRPANRFQP